PAVLDNHRGTRGGCTLPLHDALPIYAFATWGCRSRRQPYAWGATAAPLPARSSATAAPRRHIKPRWPINRLVRAKALRPTLSALDRKSTRLNSSHVKNSYAVFCLKKK